MMGEAVRGWVRNGLIGVIAALVALAVILAVRTSTGSSAPPSTVGSTSAGTSAPVRLDSYPTSATTGVPEGWVPKLEWTGEQTVWEDGAVIEDVRLTDGVLFVRAENVTVRRVELVDSRILNDYGRECFNGLRLEDVSVVRGPRDLGVPVVQSGGFTATRLKIDGPSEGIRVSEKAIGCGPAVVEKSWIRATPPENCVADKVDWHGDGIQGYLGPELTVRDSHIELVETEGCLGTAAFFYPDQGNTAATIENVLMSGGSYVFRLGTTGSVTGLKIVNDSWIYGPLDVTDCGAVQWGMGNEIVEKGTDGYLRAVAPLRCGPQ